METTNFGVALGNKWTVEVHFLEGRKMGKCVKWYHLKETPHNSDCYSTLQKWSKEPQSMNRWNNNGHQSPVLCSWRAKPGCCGRFPEILNVGNGIKMAEQTYQCRMLHRGLHSHCWKYLHMNVRTGAWSNARRCLCNKSCFLHVHHLPQKDKEADCT